MARVLAIYITLAFSLFLCGTECNISFSTSGATSNSYNKFIKALRAQLTNGTTAIYDIPVLNPSVPDSQRFLLVDLSNNGNNTITVAVDVVNVSVVAYRARAARSYFLADAPDEALDMFVPYLTNPETTKHRSTLYRQGPTRVSLQPGGQSQRDTCQRRRPITARHVSTSEANHNMTRVDIRTKIETIFYK